MGEIGDIYIKIVLRRIEWLEVLDVILKLISLG